MQNWHMEKYGGAHCSGKWCTRIWCTLHSIHGAQRMAPGTHDIHRNIACHMSLHSRARSAIGSGHPALPMRPASYRTGCLPLAEHRP